MLDTVMQSIKRAYESVMGYPINDLNTNMLATVHHVDMIYIIHFIERELNINLYELFTYDSDILIPNNLANAICKIADLAQ